MPLTIHHTGLNDRQIEDALKAANSVFERNCIDPEKAYEVVKKEDDGKWPDPEEQRMRMLWSVAEEAAQRESKDSNVKLSIKSLSSETDDSEYPMIWFKDDSGYIGGAMASIPFQYFCGVRQISSANVYTDKRKDIERQWLQIRRGIF